MDHEIVVRNKKRVIGKAGIIFAVIILLLTFFSKTIDFYLMPKVMTVGIANGTVDEKLSASGQFAIENKELVKAYGKWDVIEVVARSGSVVSKGDTLAIVDAHKVELDIQTAQMSLTKMKNAYEKYVADFNITLQNTERDLQLTQRRVESSQENVKLTEELYWKGSKTQDDLNKAKRNLEDNVYDLTLKQTLHSNRQKEYDNVVEEREWDIHLKTLELEELLERMPVDGVITALNDGRVLTVNIKEGDTTAANSIMFEIASQQTKNIIKWKAGEDSASYSPGTSVLFTVSGRRNAEADFQAQIISDRIDKREYLPESKMYEYYSEIGKEYVIQDSQTVGIVMVKSQASEDDEKNSLVVKSAVVSSDEDNYIFVARHENTIWGIRDYAQRIPVTVVKTGEIYIEIKANFRMGDRVIINSSSPLSDGTKIRMR